MPIISLIVAMDNKGGLGKENQLLCHLPADLKHFKALTMGKPIIMGIKTYRSIGKALPDRLNIVLSKHTHHLEDATVVDSLEKAIKLTSDAPEIMIIGGANVFQQALPLAHRIYLTQIHETFEADVFFPTLDKTLWEERESTFRPKDEKNKHDMTFLTYHRIPIHSVARQI